VGGDLKNILHIKGVRTIPTPGLNSAGVYEVVDHLYIDEYNLQRCLIKEPLEEFHSWITLAVLPTVRNSVWNTERMKAIEKGIDETLHSVKAVQREFENYSLTPILQPKESVELKTSDTPELKCLQSIQKNTDELSVLVNTILLSLGGPPHIYEYNMTTTGGGVVTNSLKKPTPTPTLANDDSDMYLSAEEFLTFHEIELSPGAWRDWTNKLKTITKHPFVRYDTYCKKYRKDTLELAFKDVFGENAGNTEIVD
jgi:hypothetical protein